MGRAGFSQALKPPQTFSLSCGWSRLVFRLLLSLALASSCDPSILPGTRLSASSFTLRMFERFFALPCGAPHPMHVQGTLTFLKCSPLCTPSQIQALCLPISPFFSLQINETTMPPWGLFPALWSEKSVQEETLGCCGLTRSALPSRSSNHSFALLSNV